MLKYLTSMSKPIVIASNDPVLDSLHFKAYRSNAERRVRRFLPSADEPQEMEVYTPWGEALTAQAGDYLVSETSAPDDVWPVKPDIFEATYTILQPGICVKKSLTYLVPMTDLTNGDPDQQVSCHSLEGVQTVRAGDFYLARGVKNEIWCYPKDKIGTTMIPAE